MARIWQTALVVVASFTVCTTTAGAIAPERASPSGLYREFGRPATPTTEGLVILIHGGGWRDTGPSAVAAERAAAAQFKRRGWSTLNIDYRPGRRSVPDALAFYDQARRRHRGLPICTFGESSGGHLAVLLAALRPSVACAISQGGPMDLASIGAQTARDPAGPGTKQWIDGPRSAMGLAVAAFGIGGLVTNSPVHYASRLRSPVLLGTSTYDWIVPLSQGEEMQRRRPDLVKHLRLDGAYVGGSFTHAPITIEASKKWARAIDNVLIRAVRRAHTVVPRGWVL